MRSYLGQSLGDVLLAFSTNEPVPGGGSAVALSGALGVSLLLMVDMRDDREVADVALIHSEANDPS